MNKKICMGIFYFLTLGILYGEEPAGKINDLIQSLADPQQEQKGMINTQEEGSISYPIEERETQVISSTPELTQQPSGSNTKKKKPDYANMPIPVGAKLVTMRTELSFPVTQEKYTVIEFPFEIKAELGEFEAVLTEEEANSLSETKGENQRQPVSIAQKENKLIINSSLVGKIEAVIWGGQYPIVANIMVNPKKDKNLSHGYYVVREQDVYIRNGSKVKKLENNNHEKVIGIITAAMYKDLKPKGYERRNVKKSYKYKEYDIELVHDYSLEGDHYAGEKWEIINKNKTKPLNLYEEMFYVPGTYSISFFANPIGPGKSTSMYIVKKNNLKKNRD